MLRSAVLALGVGFIVTSSAVGAPDGAEDNVIYKKHTIITFDGVDIGGERETPQITDINVRPRAAVRRLLRVRTSFRLELLGSANQL